MVPRDGEHELHDLVFSDACFGFVGHHVFLPVLMLETLIFRDVVHFTSSGSGCLSAAASCAAAAGAAARSAVALSGGGRHSAPAASS